MNLYGIKPTKPASKEGFVLPDGTTSSFWFAQYACPHCGSNRTTQNDKCLAEEGYYERTSLKVCGNCGGKYTHSS